MTTPAALGGFCRIETLIAGSALGPNDQQPLLNHRSDWPRAHRHGFYPSKPETRLPNINELRFVQFKDDASGRVRVRVPKDQSAISEPLAVSN